MIALWAHHETTHQFNPHLASRLLEKEWFDAPAVHETPDRVPTTPNAFNGLLGVLRQEGPAAQERQRRYDFWDKPS